jgi:uncharacterized repeat protein (TIGR01451 family)
MRLQSIISRIKRAPRKTALAAALFIGVALPVTVFAAWGPDRPTYDWNEPADRKGSLNGPVFNSFINTPSYGDERNFVTVSDAGTGQWRDSVNATPGEEVEVRVYVHNDANQNTNASGLGVAKNTRVRVYIPEGTANGFDVAGYVSADNATPARVYDTGLIKNDAQAFALNYVPGSAKIYNNSAWTNGTPLPDAVVSEQGTQIGYDQLNGDLPGCFEYRAVITVKMKVTAPALHLEKKVATPGSSEWRDRLTAKAGDTVSWLIDYKNTGTSLMENINIRDQLPAGTQVVPGSVMMFDSNFPNGQQLSDTGLFSDGGVNVGNYAPNGGGFIRFRTVVTQEVVDCKARNIAYGSANNVPNQEDDAEVVIENCEPVVAVVSCDALNAQALGNRTFRYTVEYTAQNAVLKTISYDFGDDSEAFVTDKTTADHTYAADGEYTTRATLTFDVDGEERTVSGDNCMTTISAKTPKEYCPIPGKEHLPKDSPECKETPVTPVTPVDTPTTLPNTGAGDVAVIFAAVTAGATMATELF